MKQIHYTISPDIFEMFPGYTRGLVVAINVNNNKTSADTLRVLRAEEAVISSKMQPQETLLTLPEMVSWREAFRITGANPSEFRPAHEALARRALQGKLLPDINPAVNIGNTLSLRHRLPVGVHPLDSVKSGMELRFAGSDDTFIALGSEKRETPHLGEIVFTDGNEVMSRNWVWRQGKYSVTLPTTLAIVVNIDGMPPVGETQVRAICLEATEMLRCSCGGEFSSYLLSAMTPTALITIP